MKPLVEQIKADRIEALQQGDHPVANFFDKIIAKCVSQARLRSKPLMTHEVVRIIEEMKRGLTPLLEHERDRERRLMLRRLQDSVSKYLRTELSDEEIETIVVRQNTVMDSHQIIRYLHKNYAGRYNSNRVEAIVRDITQAR